MDIQGIVAQLRQEASRIEQAIAALVGLGSQPARRGRPPKGSQAKPGAGQKRRRMSAAAGARIAAAKKAWWAKQKGKTAAKKLTLVAKKSAGRKPMSAAAKKKLSEMMKARWAEKEEGVDSIERKANSAFGQHPLPFDICGWETARRISSFPQQYAPLCINIGDARHGFSSFVLKNSRKSGGAADLVVAAYRG